ncbi:MAG: hypothetical protein RLY89_1750 [Bacteroidota bacterium]
MRLPLLLIALLFGCFSYVKSQTYSEITTNNIRMYHQFRYYLFNNQDTGNYRLKKTKELYVNLQNGINKFYENSKESEYRFTIYLRWVSTMDLGKKLLEWKSYANCIIVLEPLLNYIKSNTPPFNASYKFEGETYYFNDTHFYYLKNYGDYYTGYAQYMMGKDEQAFQSFYRFFNTRDLPITEGFEARKAMIEMYKRSPSVVNKDWYTNSLMFLIYYYNLMDPATQDKIDQKSNTSLQYIKLSKENQALYGYGPKGQLFKWANAIIEDAESANPEIQIYDYCAQLAPIMVKYDSTGKISMKLYDLAYKHYWSSGRSGRNNEYTFTMRDEKFHLNALALSKKFKTQEPIQSKELAMTTLEFYAKEFKKNFRTNLWRCEVYEEVANQYLFWGEQEKAKEYQDKVKPCLKENKKLLK